MTGRDVVEGLNDNTMDGAHVPEVPLRPSGIGAGVMVETNEGPQPVEWLRRGDLVLTRDHGYQPLLWVGRSAEPDQSPVRIFAGALGKRTPEHDLVLSANHHILLRSPQVALHFAQEEVFAPVRAIATEAELDFLSGAGRHRLCQLIFARHEVVLAEGVWMESFHATETTLATLTREDAARVRSQIGNEVETGVTARMVVSEQEISVLRPRFAVLARRMAA